MKIKKPITMLGATVAGAVVIALVAAPIAAFAAAPAAPTTSTNPIWLSSGLSTPVLLSAPPKLNASVYAAKSSNPADRQYTIPAGATVEYEFLSERGKEFNLNTWTTFSDPHTDPGANINLKISGFLSANPGKSFDVVGNNGGDFSLGVAFLSASGAVVEADFAYITITGNPNPVAATYEFSTPAAAATAPVVTTQPVSTTVAQGGTATFTAAASGTPTPTVQWESASSAAKTFTPIAGATSTTLTVTAQAADAGTQYRAVFLNSAGSATSNVAVLTVTSVIPTQPTAGDPGNQGSVNVPAGSTTFSKTLTGVAAGVYSVYAWSTPTQLPNATVDGAGNVTINIAGLPAGTHTIALTAQGSSTVVAWLTITIAAPLYTTELNTPLTVDVVTTNKFALEGTTNSINLGSAARGATTTPVTTPDYTVTDDRNLLPGWDLNTKVANFVNPTANNDVIPPSALTIEPISVGPAITNIGVSPAYQANSTGSLFAQGLANTSTPSTGTKFKANLTFTVPTTAKAGTYQSTLTLTLTSK